MDHRQRGFTLIELMIVVTIVAILAAIGYPSYTEYVRRSARSEAKGALLESAQFLERIYTTSNSYASDSAGNAINTAALPIQQTPREGAAKYNITLAPTATTFILTATPTGVMAGDTCGALTLNNVGVKGSADNATCWNK